MVQVVMLFERDFWGGADMFGRLAPSTQERGKFFLFYSYTGISGIWQFSGQLPHYLSKSNMCQLPFRLNSLGAMRELRRIMNKHRVVT